MLGGSRVVLYPLFHPAAALYTPRMLEVLETDFRRLPELLGRTPSSRRRPPLALVAGAGAGRGRRARPARPLLTRPSPRSGPRDRLARGDGVARRPARRRASSPATSSRSPATLGSGKTTFVRGACRALGVDEAGLEPDVHDRPPVRGAAFRSPISTCTGSAAPSAEEWGDLEPYFDGTIAFVEWPEHAGGWLGPVRAAVTLEHVDESHRRITIESDDDLRL